MSHKKHSGAESDRPKSDSEILQEQMQDSLHEYRRNNHSLFLSSLAAGLEIGFSLFLMAAFYSHFSAENDQRTMYMLMALSYPIGFMLVIIGRSDLFTEHTTLAILPVLSGRQKIPGLMRVWALIYSGNMLGALLFSILFVQFVDMTDRLDGGVFAYYAKKLLGDNISGQFVGAIFAGWLMGLLGWMVASSAETISRMAVIALITFVIGLGGLAHCIAGAVGIFCALLSESSGISYVNGLLFLIVATIGNTIGGSIFVGFVKYSYVATGHD
ncbi:formate/nitrite transporter family protein [Microbulbifer hydrolyticus]|uniref:Formate/nitrite transporter FocA (FNT family) n=1 Tax=Microbulbifer hydrolyticus TaxID=48074 RepID=A0A6P1T3L6_9GAMM|nr:formate/nitrite transporter family protein [Microbulbifer hydrolyticus]MBB5211739.1 formate/nitrite transporter FocA (FNT family) [Microbulbifer hydrolyticus]QHQ37534.1 formate/nitrite transporter family protein [Microbulbifer hydrolyticus]